MQLPCPHPADAVSLFLCLTPSSLRRQLCPPCRSRFLQMHHTATLGVGRCPFPLLPATLERGQVQTRASSAGTTGRQVSSQRQRLQNEQHVTFCSQADMQIIVVLLQFAPSSLTQFCSSSQHGLTLTSASSTSAHSSLPLSDVRCFFSPLLTFCSVSCVFACHGNFTLPPLVFRLLHFSSSLNCNRGGWGCKTNTYEFKQ